jgi:hypothetical protein
MDTERESKNTPTHAAPSPARHGGCKRTQPPRRLPSPATKRARDLQKEPVALFLRVSGRGILEAVREPSTSFVLLTSFSSADRGGKSAITFTTKFQLRTLAECGNSPGNTRLVSTVTYFRMTQYEFATTLWALETLSPQPAGRLKPCFNSLLGQSNTILACSAVPLARSRE